MINNLKTKARLSEKDMADLFKEIVPSILQTKKNALLTEQDEKSYPHFMVGRALSN